MFQKLQVELLTENVRDGSFECDSDNVSVFINALEGAWKNKIKTFELTFTYGQMQNLILVADLLKACPKIKSVKLQIITNGEDPESDLLIQWKLSNHNFIRS